MHAAAHKLFIWVFLFTRSTDRNLIKSHEKKNWWQFMLLSMAYFWFIWMHANKISPFFFSFQTNVWHKNRIETEMEKRVRDKKIIIWEIKPSSKFDARDILVWFGRMESVPLSLAIKWSHTIRWAYTHFERKKKQNHVHTEYWQSERWMCAAHTTERLI